MPNWTHFVMMLGRGKQEEENTKRWRKRELSLLLLQFPLFPILPLPSLLLQFPSLSLPIITLLDSVIGGIGKKTGKIDNNEDEEIIVEEEVEDDYYSGSSQGEF